MKLTKLVGIALTAGALTLPQVASAQQDMCGSSGATLVCTRAKFVLSGGNLQVYLFNGSTSASKAILSSIQGVGVYNLSSYGGSWGLGSVFYVDNGNNAGVGTDVSSDWSFVTGFPGLAATFNEIGRAHV